MNTFAELKLENERLWGELNSLTKKSEELKEKINNLLTEEELAKAFKPFEVTVETKSLWSSKGFVRLKCLDTDESIPILKWVDGTDASLYLDRAWKTEGRSLFEELVQKDFNNTPKTYEEATKRLEKLKGLETEINSLFEKFDSVSQYDEYVECLQAIKDIQKNISKNYYEAKNAFILEKYGDIGTIVVGKNYFLYDTGLKNEIAFVEVIEKEESGLGYRCIDHEADNKKYTHVRAERLKEDLRDFPSDEFTLGPKD